MPSKTSLFNREIFLQIVMSSGWISLIYFLGLLVSLPIRILMIYTENNTYKHTPEMVVNLFRYDLEIQVILFVVIPILMSIFLFRFLQVKQSAEFISPNQKGENIPSIHFEWNHWTSFTSDFSDNHSLDYAQYP